MFYGFFVLNSFYMRYYKLLKFKIQQKFIFFLFIKSNTKLRDFDEIFR